ncbi:SpaA isopeptide-forming pilin-related protein [Blautia sp. MSJ-19]|uniref:SpaA isopeptide-forming pilin-related protein n=1 Tax=Blautia sp. MSJ-19 TaxID=2841517 RepID=UPI001C0F2899|nr:SpaA isopeptide-forming pilin-related protein [Blautia sp. MSJ-19]MBU5482285.1 hypothetical protein [Blautia sp. MSJ-19]
MKKRKWHKITAVLACAAVMLSSPGVTDLVKGSTVEFVDMEPVETESDDASLVSEQSYLETETASEESEIHFENGMSANDEEEEQTESVDIESAQDADEFSSGEEFTDDIETEILDEEVCPESAETVLGKADATEHTEVLQGQPHKVKISSSVPAGQEAAKVRLYLTDVQNECPATDLQITLQNGETEQKVTDETIQLSGALNQKEVLTITPVTEYQTDEDGDYVYDEEGNYEIAARYLEYEVPAGGSTEFCASIVYATDAEEYSYQAELRVEMSRENEEGRELLPLKEEDSRITLNWNSEADEAELVEMIAEYAGETNEKIVYFAAPKEWTDAGYQMKVWMQAGDSGDGANNQSLLDMNALNTTYEGMEVYSATFTDAQMPYGGLARLYFQAFDTQWKAEEQAIISWTADTVFLGKLYDSKTKSWVDYTPFDPNDHTSFAGKTMYFENDTEDSLDAVTANFYEKDTDGNLQLVGQPVVMTSIQNGFYVTIPSEACSYVQFTDADGKVLGDTYSNFYGQGTDEADVESTLFAVGSTDCYKYAGTAENSTWGVLGARTIYYDATLSKMSYSGSSNLNGGKGIPYDSSSKVYYYAVKSDGTAVNGEMTAVDGTDLWRVSLSGEYTKIRFAGYAVKDANAAANGDGTDLVDIPQNMSNPCYFGDDSDDAIYKGGNRGGYWGEKGSTRDAESGKDTTVTDIVQSTFNRNPSTLYVNSTFYDYYTDCELNGNNRDNYDQNNPPSGSQRSYVTFRQFDQALSDYYSSNNVRIPIYTGHFQPDYSNWGTRFSAIADTLNLYGYNKSNQNGFMSTNNSTLNANGNSTYYDAAAQGLVADTLSNGSLMAAGGTAQEPHFSESFLTGANSKNTVLGKIYHNVAFPFTKQKLDINGNKCDDNTTNVDYWYFDSADTTLAMRQDNGSGEYYLQDTGNQSWSQNVNSSSQTSGVSNTYGFFPFNETATACSASNYNYGFGTKLEFTFRLTDDGQVTASDGTTKFPIQFTFSGDDDVWVYVDGKLALDVGGAHGRVTGALNFADKTATVSRTKVSQGSGSEDTNVTTSFTLSGTNGDEHKLTMFYMERGMWESNMKVTFNFPDENQLQVEKQVDTTEVNDLFKDLFKNTSLFNFSIKNLATHYGTKAASSSTTDPVKISNLNYTLSPTNKGNTFAKGTKEGFTDAAHWYAREQDIASNYRDQRYGELTLDGVADISKMQYLEFKFYYDYPDTPSLSNMYLQLVDAAGKEAGCLNKETLSGRTYGTVAVKNKSWVTVKLDLSRLSWAEGFDKTNLKKIRFGYNYPRNFYLKDFIFRPTAELTSSTGFVTKQYDIADYGSATSGKLENPTGAVYTSSAKSGAYAIEEDGSFVLQDKEKITFTDQFRRGSYIYLKEEADPDLFETTWTMYENGQPVTSMGTGSNVTNGSVSSLNKVAGTSVEDGRTEAYITGNDTEGRTINNAYTGTKPSENTFVFRSYADPDNTTTLTKLKAVFYNKVKTGSLTIKKEAAYQTDQLDGTYRFKLTFTNVGGTGLETAPIELPEISLKAGESYTITGIPVGTFFTIEEVTPDDGSTLDSIWLNGVQQEAGTIDLHGDINASLTQAEVVFKNTKKPKVNLSVEKLWKTENGETYTGEFPDTIYVQLQRKQADTDIWQAVEYNGKSYAELTYNIYTQKRETSFMDLDKYVDYTQEIQIPWQYRIVEVTVTKDADGNVTAVTPVENGNSIEFSEGNFTVSYDYGDTGISIGDDGAGSATITNIYQPPKTNLQILKIKAGTSGENLVKLAGATFRLEKLNADGTVDTAFTAQDVTTDDENGELGFAKFTDLSDGTYRITEIKAPEGYNLLKAPITVVIDRKGKSITVDGGENSIGSLQENTLTIQVANQAKFQLPVTGSWSRLILGFGGAILAGTAVIMYLLLQKRRKEGKAS